MFKKKKLNNLTIKDCDFFLSRIYFTSNDWSQNTFFNQPTLDMLELKKDEGADYVVNWKSVGKYNFKPLHTAFLHSIKRSR